MHTQGQKLTLSKQVKIGFCFMCVIQNGHPAGLTLRTYTQHTLWRSFHSCLPVKEHVGTLFSLKLLLNVLQRNGWDSGVIQVKPMTSVRVFCVSCGFWLYVLWAAFGWSWTDWFCWTGFCGRRNSIFQSYTGSIGDQHKDFRVVLKKLEEDKWSYDFFKSQYSYIDQNNLKELTEDTPLPWAWKLIHKQP